MSATIKESINRAFAGEIDPDIGALRADSAVGQILVPILNLLMTAIKTAPGDCEGESGLESDIRFALLECGLELSVSLFEVDTLSPLEMAPSATSTANSSIQTIQHPQPGTTVSQCINANLWGELESEIAAIEADSLVGTAVITLLNRLELAIEATPEDRGGIALKSYVVNCITDAGIRQANVWYFG